jgi:hypothetical protein
MRKILGLGLVVVVGVVLLLGPSVTASDAPLQSFASKMKIIRERVNTMNTNVVSALNAKSWASWCNNHEAYMRELSKAQRDIEDATSSLMMSTIAGGGNLDSATIEAMDLAATQAANYARIRVIINAYGRFTRLGVDPRKRKDALDLLMRQGIYEQDTGAGGVMASTAEASRPEIMDSPMTGRVPGNPQAAQYLSRWQQAVMKANAAAQRIASFESELASMPAQHEMRPVIEQRAAAAAAQYDRLLNEAKEMRKRYFQVGGK